MKELTNKIEKDMVKVWHIRSYITLAVFFIICGIYVFLMMKFQLWFWPAYVIGGIGIISFICSRYVTANLKYKTFRYEIREDEMEIQSGVFIITRVLIPMNRIQYVTMEQGPIMKKYGLAELEISTAAPNHSIEGITEERAEELRRIITDLVKEREEDA